MCAPLRAAVRPQFKIERIAYAWLPAAKESNEVYSPKEKRLCSAMKKPMFSVYAFTIDSLGQSA